MPECGQISAKREKDALSIDRTAEIEPRNRCTAGYGGR
jgi:hypothetical protein